MTRVRIIASLGVTLGILVVLMLASAWLFGTNLVTPGYVHQTPAQGLHPRREEPYAIANWGALLGNPRQSLGLNYEQVVFEATDGSMLRGWLIAGTSNKAIVAVHGGETDRRSWLRHTPMFHAAGYSVLLFDMREHGVSDGAARGIAFGWRGNHDVSAAVDYMKQAHGYDQLVVIGTSMGAVSALIAASRNDNIDLVIAENPFASAADVLGDSDLFDRLPHWYAQLVVLFTRLKFDVLNEPDAIDIIAQIAPRPLLLMHGTADKAVSVWQSELLYKAAKQPKELWVLEGAGHTGLYNHAPQEFERRVLGFLSRYTEN